MARRFLLATLIILLFAVIVYAWLGGFTPLTYEVSDISEIRITGKEFTGRPNQQELEDLFYKMQELAVRNDTSLMIVTYSGPDSTTVFRQFVGVPGLVSDTLETRVWPAGQYIRVVLSQNLMVTASPESVLKEAEEFSESQGFELSGESIEVYSKSSDTEVLFPLAR